MDKNKAVDILTRQYKRQNEYIKYKYDRVSVVMPRGMKDKIRAALGGSETLNSFINDAIESELQRRAVAPEPGTGIGSECPF